MNAHPGIPLPVPHPTIEDRWTVTWLGAERTITREGTGFIAWIGCQFKCWSFEGARKQCVDDIEHQKFLHDRAEALQRGGIHRLAKLTPEQFAYVLAARERELAGLSVNSPGRADMLREDIRIMKEARARS